MGNKTKNEKKEAKLKQERAFRQVNEKYRELFIGRMLKIDEKIVKIKNITLGLIEIGKDKKGKPIKEAKILIESVTNEEILLEVDSSLNIVG